jgi:hypothetical protein
MDAIEKEKRAAIQAVPAYIGGGEGFAPWRY